MFITDGFGKRLDILKKEMDVSLLRQQVIANNIANSDTPNFKRTDVTFEAELKRALDSEKKPVYPNLMRDERHIAFSKVLDYREVQPKRVLDYLTTAKNNGNNVDMEVEAMNAMENQLMYQTMAQMVQSEFTRVNMVLK